MKISKTAKINFAAGVGADLFLQGSTSIPNLLLKHYKHIGITDEEMFLIIILLRIKDEDKDCFPSPEKLAAFMTTPIQLIKSILNSLVEKEIIILDQYWHEQTEQAYYIYRYDALYEKLSEFWACEKCKELQKGQPRTKVATSLEETAVSIDSDLSASLIFRSFQREFGRLLTSIEIEQIKQWLDEDYFAPELINEALKKAVLLGKLNFKYVDKILLEWKKNNLRTLKEIQGYDDNFKARQGVKSSNNKQKPAAEQKTQDKYKYIYRN